MVNEIDMDAANEAIETLKEAGFEVASLERVSGFENAEFDTENEEEIPLGRTTNIELAVRSHDFERE